MATFTDVWLFELAQQLHHPVATRIFIFITNLGDWRTLLFLGTVLALTFWLQQKKIEAYVFLGAYIFSQISIYVLKHGLARVRPDIGSILITQTGFSFPSGHAFGAIAFYGFLIYLLSKNIRNTYLRKFFLVGGVTLILLIGFSRIYLGVHWPSDVAAGLGMGAGALAGSIFIMEKLQNTS